MIQMPLSPGSALVPVIPAANGNHLVEPAINVTTAFSTGKPIVKDALWMSMLSTAAASGDVTATALIGSREKLPKQRLLERGQQRRKFYKTRLCPHHFKKGGVCKGGSRCSYAHSFQELRPSIDLTKTKMCQDFAVGVCARSSAYCPFAHGTVELRPVQYSSGEESALDSHAEGEIFCHGPVGVEVPEKLVDRAATIEIPSEYISQPNRILSATAAPGIQCNFTPENPLPQNKSATPVPLGTRSFTFDEVVLQDARPVMVKGVVTSASTETNATLSTQTSLPGSSPQAAGEGKCTSTQEKTSVPKSTVVPSNSMISSILQGSTNNPDDPQLVITVTQLANIILAAHAAESPTSMVADVLNCIYRS